MNTDGSKFFWNSLAEELTDGLAHLLRKYELQLDRNDEREEITLYKMRDDGLKSAVEIRLHEEFCFISVCASISRHHNEYWTPTSGDIVTVLAADETVFDIARSAEIALLRTLSWDYTKLIHIKPPWHKPKRGRRNR